MFIVRRCLASLANVLRAFAKFLCKLVAINKDFTGGGEGKHRKLQIESCVRRVPRPFFTPDMLKCTSFGTLRAPQVQFLSPAKWNSL